MSATKNTQPNPSAPSIAISKYQWGAVEVTAEQYGPMREFVRDVLGLSLLADYPDIAIFAAPDGSLFELYGPTAPQTPWRNGHNGSAVGFDVEDLDASLAALRAVGMDPVHPPESVIEALAGDGIEWHDGIWRMEHSITTGVEYRYMHVRGPDGRIYALAQSEPKSV